MNENFMVYVSCMTYNQSLYIKDALDGFCMQQTHFPFVCAIIDDASTDGEADVILQYFENHFDLGNSTIVRREKTGDYSLFFAQHKENKNCYFVVVLLSYNHYQIKKTKEVYLAEWQENAKYLALCEGDDYWIDPLKLQKQVDFMEMHPAHSLCFCAYKRLVPNGEMNVIKRYAFDIESCPIEDVILGGGGYMATNSMLFRRSLYVSYQTWAIDCPIGDFPLMLTLANTGHVGYLTDVMCVYRYSSNGSWSMRVASSRVLRKRHYRAIIKMLHQFDEWSGRKYHRIVKRKIWINRQSYYKSILRRVCQ